LKKHYINLVSNICMGLFGKKKKDDKKTNTICKVCDLELHQPERLERHMKKAHGNVPEKKPEFSTKGGVEQGGMW
jgi:hypothetical protein